jgi:hypothetical protein
MNSDPRIIFSEMIENIKDSVKDEIHTSLPAKITKVDLVNGYCECDILAKFTYNDKEISFPPLVDVMLDYNKFGNWKFRIPRSVGDYVWIGFSKYAYDNLLESGEKNIINSQESFSLNGSYIIRGIKLDTETLNSSYAEDILLENTNGTIIAIKGNGDIYLKAGSNSIIVDGDVQINGGLNATKEIESEIDCISGGVSGKNHITTLVTPGLGTSGPPQ